VPFWTARCSFSPANAETGEKKDIFETFPAILPFSLSTPLAQKSRMTHTHIYTTIPCNSHATMPCTWTGYGEHLPRLLINTGERIEPGGGGWFFEKERNTRGGKILEEGRFWKEKRGEHLKTEKRETEQEKKNRERRRTEREEWTNWKRKRKIYLRYRGEKAKTDIGREKQRLRSLHRGEEGPFLTTWAPPLCFLSTATTAPSSCHHQRCQRQQNQRGRRETGQNREGRRKKQRPRALHRGGEEKTAAPPPGIIIISPPSRCPDHLPLPPDHKRGRTEQTRGRGRDSRRQQEEEKKNCNSSIAAWNNARLPPQAAVSSATRALPFQVTLFSVFSSSWLVSCMQSVYCSRFCSKRNN